MTVNPSNVSSQKRPQVPRFWGLRLGPSLAGVLYLLLAGSAVLALWVKRFPGEVPGLLEKVAPWVFLLFVVVFAIYRLVLVRARRYPTSKAFFQIGAAALFFTLLLPQARTAYRAPPEEGLELLLLEDANPHVRALAAEVARHRSDRTRYAPLLVRALEDPDPEVRAQAHRSLVEMTGEDLGAPPGAIEAWRRRYP